MLGAVEHMQHCITLTTPIQYPSPTYEVATHKEELQYFYILEYIEIIEIPCYFNILEIIEILN